MAQGNLRRSSDHLMEDREAGEYYRKLAESSGESNSQIEKNVAFIRELKEYWNKVHECEGFDIDGIHAPQGSNPLVRVDCKKVYRYPAFVDLYAELGLHHYNLLEGTNFQFSELIKYNMTCNCLSSY
ncbi:unnamed protein product [Eruca vesicaria subsp. sativa]|uniref:Uncharacterized protein n=1 Tax=Eruca vesicaria subsp. sativa TaxID=29727 RepID=A0ABC8JSZ3_ERUVS|nr:unnamed protein product [Eruca vesicaria subsp. sativa]